MSLIVSERLSGGLLSHFGQPGESMSPFLHTADGQVGSYIGRRGTLVTYVRIQ